MSYDHRAAHMAKVPARAAAYHAHRAKVCRVRRVREHAPTCTIYAWQDGEDPYLCRCNCGAEVPR